MAKKKAKKDSKADFIARKLAVINLIADEDKARKMANRILFNKQEDMI